MSMSECETHRRALMDMVQRLQDYLDSVGLDSWQHGACWAAEESIKNLLAENERLKITVPADLGRRIMDLQVENERLEAAVQAVRDACVHEPRVSGGVPLTVEERVLAALDAALGDVPDDLYVEMPGDGEEAPPPDGEQP